MSTRPWMPFYFADYLADTAHLSTTEHGAYLLLIAHYWAHGGLPKEEATIARITRMTARQWSQSRDVLRSLFGDEWCHKRIDHELTQAIEKSRTNSANAKRRLSGRSANAQRTHTQSQSQLQSEEKKEEESSLRSESITPEKPDDWPKDFREQFWKSYPRKLEKKATIKALERTRASRVVPFERLMTAVRAYAATADPQFTKHPTTWLSKGCWDDEHLPLGEHANGKRSANNSARDDAIIAGVGRAFGFRNGEASRPNDADIPRGRHELDLEPTPRA